MENRFMLPRASTPEEVGVDGKVIAEFLDAIENEGWNIHSFMVVRHGKVAAECYRAPFTKERPHAMYSVSKTFTGTAVGIAVREGLLSLDDRVRDFFPEILADVKDERLDRMTVYHLMTMTAGKNVSLLSDKSKGHWAETFFKSSWYNEPGKEFKYISENMYILCAILKKVTGTCVRDYLQTRLFGPLGMDYPAWETDENGIEAGGWGLYATTEDIAKLMLLYHNGGELNGVRILDADFVEAATQKHIETAEANSSPDSSVGYCYCMWRNKGAVGYRADGMFSQFGIVFEEYDAVLAMTGGIPMEGNTKEFNWRFFPRAFRDDVRPDDADVILRDRLLHAKLEAPEEPSTSPLAVDIEGRTIHFRKKIFLNLIGFPMSMLPLAVTYMAADKAGNIDDVVFRFKEDALTLSWREGDEANTVRAGLNGRYCYGEMTLGQVSYKVCCTAKWLDNDSLFVSVRPIETIGKRTLEFRFRADRVTMLPSSSPSIPEITEFLEKGFKDMCHIRLIQKALHGLALLAPGIVEPKHRGRFID